MSIHFPKVDAKRKQRHVTLHFEDDKLAYIDGDVARGPERPEDLANKPTRIVDVPLREHKQRGFFSKLIGKLPLPGDGVGEEPPEQEQKQDTAEPDAQVDQSP